MTLLKKIGFAIVFVLFAVLPMNAYSQELCSGPFSPCAYHETAGQYLVGCKIEDKWDGKSGTYCVTTVNGAVNMSDRVNNQGSIGIASCSGNSTRKVILVFTGPWLDLTSRVVVSSCSQLKFKKILDKGVYKRAEACQRTYVVVEFTLEGGSNTCTNQKYNIDLYRPNTLGIGETHTRYKAS